MIWLLLAAVFVAIGQYIWAFAALIVLLISTDHHNNRNRHP